VRGTFAPVLRSNRFWSSYSFKPLASSVRLNENIRARGAGQTRVGVCAGDGISAVIEMEAAQDRFERLALA
jgi:hypothetical protein